jgi:hypothetical protein
MTIIFYATATGMQCEFYFSQYSKSEGVPGKNFNPYSFSFIAGEYNQLLFSFKFNLSIEVILERV